MATQTDVRSYTQALKLGSVKSLQEMKISTGPEVDIRSKNLGCILHVEVTKF
ncbi:hypothetical protein DPMN_106629 [Dreissena polymorpha]|uniref:Uncharacterized protein n=1 Tax=Dreissena polymorpha TaxID=45954 RepID=A0A9D4QIS2_DREPO|nr:hypothetical protein DPMN_106629 [Dreissena polymorpha]